MPTADVSPRTASAEDPGLRDRRGPALRAVEPDSRPPRATLPAPARPLAVWIVATPLAGLAGAELAGLAIAVAAVAALAAALLVPGAARAFAVVAMLPAALAPGVPPWAWVVGGSALALASAAAAPRRPAPVVAAGDDLRRQLARARRRGEPLALLVVRGDERDVHALLGRLRWTDAGEIARHDGGPELHCLLDVHGLDRDGVERRIRAAARRPVTLGWATFPDDGLTVEALRDVARGRLRAGRPEAPAGDVRGEDAQHVAQSTSPGG